MDQATIEKINRQLVDHQDPRFVRRLPGSAEINFSESREVDFQGLDI